jgi:predicted HicB family RNase H-like nuclease
MVNYNHYSYRIIWSVEDQEFVGLCAEFPGLSYLGVNQSAALSGITDLVKGVVDEMQTNSEIVPEPIAEREFSGNFQVRVPPDLHRKLVIRAAEEKVSLNRYISFKLAC